MSPCSGCLCNLYADDIPLIAPSVCDLHALVETCEFELDKLDIVVNTIGSRIVIVILTRVDVSWYSHLMGK